MTYRYVHFKLATPDFPSIIILTAGKQNSLLFVKAFKTNYVFPIRGHSRSLVQMADLRSAKIILYPTKDILKLRSSKTLVNVCLNIDRNLYTCTHISKTNRLAFETLIFQYINPLISNNNHSFVKFEISNQFQLLLVNIDCYKFILLCPYFVLTRRT